MSTTQPARDENVARFRRFKEAVRSEWSDEQIVAGWRRWYGKFKRQSSSVTELLARAAAVAPGMQILDLASGPGDPAIALAGLTGASGHVTASDISTGMMAAAEENARLEGRSNMSFRQADMEALPFASGSFDAVTCRFGIMFCPDFETALSETLRVLKPGGRAAFAVWGPPFEQGFIATTMSVCAEYTSLPECELGAPNAFNYAKTGKLAALMEQAGYMQVREEYHSIEMPWDGSPQEYWQYVSETAAPLREVLEKIEAEGNGSAIPELTQRLVEAYRGYYDGERLDFPATVNIASGMRHRRQAHSHD